jgi:hypothetical protein
VVLYQTKALADAKARSAVVTYLTNMQANVAPPTREDWQEPRWEEARINIRWVFGDAGATQAYAAGRSGGLSKFAALLAAQGHSPNAQRTIAEFGEVRTEKYVTSLGH